MNHVLVIDDDPGTLSSVAAILTHAGYRATTCLSAEEGRALAARYPFQLVLVDLCLAGESGLDLIGDLAAIRPEAAVVLISGFATVPVTVEAMRKGARDVFVKPLFEEDLLAITRQYVDAGAQAGPTNPLNTYPHAFARWGDVVLKAIDSPTDLRTLRAWGRHVGVAPGTIKVWCGMAGFPSRRSLLFARLLRATRLFEQHGTPPELSLDVVDRRTMRRLTLLARGTAANRAGAMLPQSVDEFLGGQTLILDTTALSEIRRRLGGRRMMSGVA